MKTLFRTEIEARRAVAAMAGENLEGWYESVCDLEDIEDIRDEELAKSGVSGEACCLRSTAGDIVTWWE